MTNCSAFRTQTNYKDRPFSQGDVNLDWDVDKRQAKIKKG